MTLYKDNELQRTETHTKINQNLSQATPQTAAECQEKTVIFIVLMEVLIKVQVFWGVTPYSADRSLMTFRWEIYASFVRVEEVHSPEIILAFFCTVL